MVVMDSLETRPDRELLELALRGDESAFRVLYERLKTPIFRYAFHWTYSEAAAEELTQDVFLLLLKEGHKYKPARGDVSAFAFGIARNLVRSFHRRERVYQELPADPGLEKIPAGEPRGDGPSAELIRREDVLRVRTAIASLPDHYRQVIVLCDLCEFGYAEAASRLECSVGTVRSRLHRAHALLGKKLKQSAKPEMELPAAGPEECLI
jgi:RNA polymerase sigma-70 factor (ECF subfamily)